MTRTYLFALLLSSFVFLAYGIACLGFEGMKRDFARFGLPHLRVLTGTLEVLGALGLIVGLWWPPLVMVSAGGLAVMMLAGVATRMSVMDSGAQTLPALALMLLNAWLAWSTWTTRLR